MSRSRLWCDTVMGQVIVKPFLDFSTINTCYTNHCRKVCSHSTHGIHPTSRPPNQPNNKNGNTQHYLKTDHIQTNIYTLQYRFPCTNLSGYHAASAIFNRLISSIARFAVSSSIPPFHSRFVWLAASIAKIRS